MGDILIIGGTTAGLEAARFLSKNQSKLGGRRLLLVDSSPVFSNSELLAAFISGRIRKTSLTFDLCGYLRKLNVNFQLGEVVSVDTREKEVKLKNGSVLSFEYLIIACGTGVGFEGRERLHSQYMCDSLEDAILLKEKVASKKTKKIIVVGGGLRGIELASAISYFLKVGKTKKCNIALVEKEDDILPGMPGKIKNCCRVGLALLRINILTECSAQENAQEGLKLSCGMSTDDALVVWACGSKAPSFVRDLDFKKDERARLLVDESMIFDNNCFAVGRAVVLKNKKHVLINKESFSAKSSRVAAKNIVLNICGAELQKYNPSFENIFILLGRMSACCKIFFFSFSGVAAYFIYSLAMVIRSRTLRMKFDIFSDLFLSSFYMRS